MTFVPVMWSVWGFTIIVVAIMFLYRSRLSKDEEDQLFLDDSFSNERTRSRPSSPRSPRFNP